MRTGKRKAGVRQPTRNDVRWLIEGGNEIYTRARAYFDKEFAPPPGLEAAFDQWRQIVAVANERLFPERLRKRAVRGVKAKRRPRP